MEPNDCCFVKIMTRTNSAQNENAQKRAQNEVEILTIHVARPGWVKGN